MSCTHASVYFAETRRSLQGDTVSCHVPTPVYNSPKFAVLCRGTQCHVMPKIALLYRGTQCQVMYPH